MRHAAKFSWRQLRRFWWGLRDWCGDSAYERYLLSKHTPSTARHTLTPAEFYIEQLEKRYSGHNRCC